MRREASNFSGDHAEAAASLRARAHRARLCATGILNEHAIMVLREYADELEAQAAALEPQQPDCPDEKAVRSRSFP